MRLRVLPILLAVLAAAVPLAWGASDTGTGTVAAAKRPPVSKSPDLWATINVCDTAAHPDTIGIRGSMLPLRRKSKSRMWMRFRVEYLSKSDNKWHRVVTNADSGWQHVRQDKNFPVESGYNVRFDPLAPGTTERLRGAVTFRWTKGGKTLVKLSRVTEAGH